MIKDGFQAEVDVLRDAKLLFEMHRNRATRPTKATNLDKLWLVLNEMRQDGERDYSLAAVGRRLEHSGGPKTQSLRNAQGAHFREIILAFAAAVNGSSRYIAKTKSNVERALELVADPSVRAALRVSLDEAKRLKVINDNLHAAFKTLQVGATLPTSAPNGAAVAASADDTNVAPHALSPRHRIALSKGISTTRLAQQGLHIAPDGSIENERGDKIFPPSFASAIQAILGVDS